MGMSDARTSILIPVDFSQPSKRAMAWAFEYAQHVPVNLHVLHVVERHMQLSDLSAGMDALKAELEEIRTEAEQQLSQLASAQRQSVGTIRQHVATGKPAAEIVRVATELGVDMVVMGTHGLTGVERVIIGSVAEQVVRKAPCTVVAVKGE